MRTSVLLLSFIFIAAEHLLLILGVKGMCEIPEGRDHYGNIPSNISYEENGRFRMPCAEGYVRQAGTSSLFICQKNNSANKYKWRNYPPLKCKPDPKKRSTPDDPVPTTVSNTQAHPTAPTAALYTHSPAQTLDYSTVGKPVESPTPFGQTAFTTTHTVATTAGTSHHTSLRTTTQEEEPMTTANSITLSSSSKLTDRHNLTTVSSESSSSHNTSTTTINTTTNPSTGSGADKSPSYESTGGIAAGTVLMLIVVTGSAAGILIWCRRHKDSSTVVEMTQTPGVDHPLLQTASSPTSSPGSAPDPLIIVQQA